MSKLDGWGGHLYDGSEPYITRESILQLFEGVDADLEGQKPIDVYVVGYSAVVLSRKNGRGSNDVDIIPSRFSSVFADHGIEMFDEHYFYFPPDYKSRAVQVERQYRNLVVRYVDPHDIWFTKLAAFRSKDKTDMVQMIRDGAVDPRKLDAMFEIWNRHWFNGNPELEAHYTEVRSDDAESVGDAEDGHS